MVRDLEKAGQFFVLLGFKIQDQARLRGDWIFRTVGLENVDAEYLRLSLPGDGVSVELIRFDSPPGHATEHSDKANTPGFRHLAFQVQDIEKAVEVLKANGVKPLSPIQEFTKTGKKMVYFPGPEGILLELAQYPGT